LPEAFEHRRGAENTVPPGPAGGVSNRIDSRVKALLDYLRRHPLVWIVPVTFFVLVLGLLAWRIARTPESPFVYRI
jgi:hypothetical protein